MVVPEEEISHLLLDLDRNIEGMPSLPLIIEQGEYVDGDSQHIRDCWDVFDSDSIWDLLKFKLLEQMDLVARLVGVLFIGLSTESKA